MDIDMPILAIIIAVLSLVLSLYTSITTRRSSQFQRLAIIRTKASNIIWKIQFDLTQYERCARKIEDFFDDGTGLMQDISFLKEAMASISEIKSKLDSIALTVSKYPFSFGAGQLDEVEHRIDSFSEGIKLASERLLPRLERLAERINSTSIVS